ncbi:hypothetical protein QE152_g28393 [Popillia japonica]|uniref:Ribosomal protein L5 n=1 Tax=Popillia japonica TaxID=7064 RepID=A0AAW1JJ12_POPJA
MSKYATEKAEATLSVLLRSPPNHKRHGRGGTFANTCTQYRLGSLEVLPIIRGTDGVAKIIIFSQTKFKTEVFLQITQINGRITKITESQSPLKVTQIGLLISWNLLCDLFVLDYLKGRAMDKVLGFKPLQDIFQAGIYTIPRSNFEKVVINFSEGFGYHTSFKFRESGDQF